MSDPRYISIGAVEVRLTEELAEVIQVIQKAQRWGWSGVNPEDGKDKLTRIIEEMMDVVAVWNELAAKEKVPALTLTARERDEGRALHDNAHLDEPCSFCNGTGRVPVGGEK